jgi:hypothetical protein
MNPTWFEIPAVVVILMFVCIVVVRAFTAPVSGSDDPVDIFMRRHIPNDPSLNGPASGREPSNARGSSTYSRERR